MKKVKKEIESNVIWGHGLVSILNRVVREGILRCWKLSKNLNIMEQ